MDKVNHPRHYNEHPSGIECIDVVRHMNFNLGNAIKYIWRAGLKGDAIEDLEKAGFYINDEIKRLKENDTMKIYTRKEVIDALFENPKRKFKMVKDVEVERKLKRMSFGEMYYIWFTTDVTGKDCISCVTGLDWHRDDCDISKEEYLGEWTIDGVFEDEE